ncbi:MAG: LacI family DNA-binding transcriptional regulator [Verrucomicrobiota bacterium JB024]|jgi:DNA-binding LacI/PurR family transcriptional regulator|nr:LacI family DNA-binding transcriptional regulator [Verrucomicrobiota bacterium JB024]
MAIGLRQLAEICKVSHTTISRALNDDPRISEAVKKHVKEVAQQYHYKPNRLVKGVMSGKTQSIAVVMSHSTKDIGGILGPIQRYFMEESYSTLVYTTENKPEIEQLSFHEAVCHRVEGLIIAPSNQKATNKFFEELKKDNIPFVIIGPNVESVKVPHVSADDLGAMDQIITHLVNLGHTRIAYLRGENNEDVIDKRYHGYLKTMQKFGLQIDMDWIKLCDWKPEQAAECAISAIRHKSRPTAIVCDNDSLAMGAMKGIRSIGLRIPEDVSITGMGDDYFAPFLSPSLTTTSKVRELVGLAAAEQLWRMISGGPDAPERNHKGTSIPVKIIERASTGPAPRQNGVA